MQIHLNLKDTCLSGSISLTALAVYKIIWETKSRKKAPSNRTLKYIFLTNPDQYVNNFSELKLNEPFVETFTLGLKLYDGINHDNQLAKEVEFKGLFVRVGGFTLKSPA